MQIYHKIDVTFYILVFISVTSPNALLFLVSKNNEFSENIKDSNSNKKFGSQINTSQLKERELVDLVLSTSWPPLLMRGQRSGSDRQGQGEAFMDGQRGDRSVSM